MAEKLKVFISHDSIEAVNAPGIAEFMKRIGGETTLRRGSHVEPFNPVLRFLFHSLRRMFGEKGRVSDFTRKWPCLWRVDLRPSGGPIHWRVWKNRQSAIDFEVSWLNRMLETKSGS